MHHPSRYNVRSLLGVTTLAALVLLPIVKPSVWWTLLFPAASSLVVVRTVSLFVVTAERGKVFWACFATGVAAYLAAVMFVGYVAFLNEADFWGSKLSVPLWLWLHGEAKYPEMKPYDFVSFIVSVHFVLAGVVAGMGALLAQVGADRRRVN